MLCPDAGVCLFSVVIGPKLRRSVEEGMVGIGATAGLYVHCPYPGRRQRVLWDCGQRRHVTGADIGEVAEVDGPPGPDVLDVGCVTGIVARQFQAVGLSGGAALLYALVRWRPGYPSFCRSWPTPSATR